jgi:hypothetical protein
MATVLKRCGCPELNWRTCPHAWVVRYRTLGGRASRQQERSFGADRREADDFALKVEHDKRARVFIDPTAGDVLFRAYAQTWLARHLGADSTVAGYRSVLNAHVFPAFGHPPLSRVRREDVKNLIAVMRGKGLSASRVREAHLVVAAICNEAVRDKLIAVSPCFSIALPEVTVNRDFIVPTAAQMDALSAGLPWRLGRHHLAHARLRAAHRRGPGRHRTVTASPQTGRSCGSASRSTAQRGGSFDDIATRKASCGR